MPSHASDRLADGDTVDTPDGRWSVELPAVPDSLDAVQDLVAELYDSGEDDLHAMDRIRFESAVVEIVGNGHQVEVFGAATPWPDQCVIVRTVRAAGRRGPGKR